ncbi:MAG: TetR family transcriptional regulator [Oscillospiraceae bacterium]|nr:TetR family transcriptional regulator [Oscillospiraceae bacterium]
MYQGTNPSALDSQRRIAGAMMDLMTARPYDAISVAALCRTAGVSRQTFYTLFRSRENVITYLLSQDAGNAPVDCSNLDAMLHAYCRSYTQFVVRKEPVLRQLAANGMMSVLFRLFSASIQRINYLQRYVCEELRPYLAGYVAAGLTSITLTYLCSDTDPDTLESVAYTLLKGQLFDKEV